MSASSLKIDSVDWPLYWRLPPSGEATKENLLDRFLDFVESQNLTLYSAQEEAILALLEGDNVILNTPTGSGKSLVALALHFQSLARGRRSFYTCPIKALVNEKFRDLCFYFGPDQVGMITGDGSVNALAPIICCTAEILSNLALREGAAALVDDVVVDEFHYYADPQRGVSWQIPLLTLAHTRFLLMSATLGDTEFFARELERLNGHPTQEIKSIDRPVPLEFQYCETPLHETITDLIGRGLAPVYLVNFSQREAAEEAQNLLSVDFASKDEKRQIAEQLAGVRFQSPYGKELQRLLRHAVGIHHAGLLPKYRLLVEKLAQQGLLKVISGTDTLGVGVNVPIRTVLLTRLCKFDGTKTAILTAREFHQISGRAGRRGYDSQGQVVAQAPAHVIENQRLKAKAGGDAKKLRKIVLKTPPSQGFVMWTKETFERLQRAQPEPLVSRFQVTHSMLLNVLGRKSDGCSAMRDLIRRCHEGPANKKSLFKKAFALFRALVERQIVEFISPAGKAAAKVRVQVSLQEDFSIHHLLSLYLIDAVGILDPHSADYALQVLTLAEAILESPEPILRRQLDRLKTQKMAEMKAEGLEYEERIERLEQLEHPKPNSEFIYETFRIFAANHPWIGAENIRPKSIAREMYEHYHSFGEYIREYDLQRVEGLLLRYLSEVYKVLVQTVPSAAQTDELKEIIVYVGALVRSTDSSVLDEWEQMKRAGEMSAVAAAKPFDPVADELFSDVTVNNKEFKLLIRNAVYTFIKFLASGDCESAAEQVDSASDGGETAYRPWNAQLLEQQMQLYLQDHRFLRADLAARHPSHLQIAEQGERWQVECRLLDPDEHNDWCVKFDVDLVKSRQSQVPVLSLVHLGPIVSM